MRKPFAPKRFGVGDTVVWRHFPHGGEPVERIGTVGCEAPTLAGNTARWVMPDEPLPGDVYSMVAVLRVARDRYQPSRLYGVPSAGKGELVSWDHWSTETGALALGAAAHRDRVKQAAAERFLDEHVIVIPVGFAAA